MFKDDCKQYRYEGPVEEFGKCIAHKWTATTLAPSAAKARSNLAYRFKQQYNKNTTTRITLPGKIVVVE